MDTVKVLKSFKDEYGVMEYSEIATYNADPLDVVEQYNNEAKHMFSSIQEDDGIPDYANKLKHRSGIVITEDGEITGEYIGGYDMPLFDERIHNLEYATTLNILTVKKSKLRVGDVIVNLDDYSVSTVNG